MAGKGRQFHVISLLIGVVLLIFIFYLFFIDSLHHKTRSRIKRFTSSCIVQTFYFMMTIYIWKHLSGLMDSVTMVSATGSSSQRSHDHRRTSVSKVWRGLLICNSIFAHLAYTTFVFFIDTDPYKLAILFYFSFGLQLNLFTGLVLIRLLFQILKYICKCSGQSFQTHKSKNLIGGLSVFYAVTISVLAFMKAHERPQIKEVTIPVQGLSPHLSGLTITFISDIHIGPTIGRSRFESVIHTVNYLDSDIVIIGGDLVEVPVSKLGEAVIPIQWINSKYGVYFVTGNHDYYTIDIENWLDKLQSLGVKNLRNQNVKIQSEQGGVLCLAGVDDPTADNYKYDGHGTKLEQALSSCDQSQPVLLAVHQPNVAKRALELKYRTDVILSGHTHGGQLFPITIATYLMNDFYAGLYRHGSTSHVYVSMGAVHSALPMRFGTHSEITRITLRPMEKDDII